LKKKGSVKSKEKGIRLRRWKRISEKKITKKLQRKRKTLVE